MGAGSSTSRGSLTRQQLLKSTQEPRDFMNSLFQQMITKLTPQDFLKLGNPKECNQYVFTMAGAIQNLFEDLQIRPRKDKDSGVVYFQKLTKLGETNPQGKELCLTIAYFYIRIFQIFGALAMTVVDDPGAGQVLGALQYMPAAAAPRKPGEGRGAFIQQGGAALDQYQFSQLYPFFTPLFNELKYSKMSGSNHISTFKDTTNLALLLVPPPGETRVYYTIQGYGQVSATITITPTPPNNLHISLSSYKFSTTAVPATISTFISGLLKQKRKVSFDAMQGAAQWYVQEAGDYTTVGKKIKSLLDALFREVYTAAGQGAAPYATQIAGPQFAGPQFGIPQRRQPRVVDPFGQQPYGQQPFGQPAWPQAQAQAQVQVQALASDQFVPKMLTNGYIINTLKGLGGQKTTAFCIARALQLMDAGSTFQLQKGKPILSGICKTRFDAVPNSVPTSGFKLDTLPAFRATEQLYYTEPAVGSQGETIMKRSSEDSAKYAEFLAEFAKLYGRPVSGGLTALESVMARDPNCVPQAMNHYLQITDPSQINKVFGFVQGLFGRQLKHTQDVLKFIQTRLLRVEKRKNPATGAVGTFVDIHPRLHAGGIVELASVSAACRDLLVNYFKSCEDIYQQGVQAVLAAGGTVVA
jgi:hypothetical protein